MGRVRRVASWTGSFALNYLVVVSKSVACGAALAALFSAFLAASYGAGWLLLWAVGHDAWTDPGVAFGARLFVGVVFIVLNVLAVGEAACRMRRNR